MFDLIRTVGTRAPLVQRLVEGAHPSGKQNKYKLEY